MDCDSKDNGEQGSGNCQNLEAFSMEAFKTLAEATKCANKLPFGRSRDLYESCPAFHSVLKIQVSDILSKLSAIMKYTNCKGNIQKRDDEDKFEMIVDINDSIMEKVGISLDEIVGVNKTSAPNLVGKTGNVLSGSWNKFGNIVNTASTQILNSILNKTKNMEKPQLKFRDEINNDPRIPFEPKITYKYNMLKPLAIMAEDLGNGIYEYSHPYEFELAHFKPCDHQLKLKEPLMYGSLEDTSLRFIESQEGVKAMVEDLQNYMEISVDLEHHSYRSFQGFTCLMQISTRDTDYIVDTLKLRAELIELNKVFTNPSIVKVFHGADLDVLWLQRDFSLYVVNLFDTHQAAKLLNFPHLSLAYLLSRYCNVLAQKHYQLADWRIRPLPKELLTYAREDTHYLLYIYDNLRNELIEKGNMQTNLLHSVLHESARICLKRYTKPAFDADGYLDIYHRSKKLFDNQQKYALQQLFAWRDSIARKSDESLAFVLPNHMMLNISEVLPREAQGILACCNPIPLPVRQNLLELHQIILKARQQPLIKPVLEEQRLFRQTALNFTDNPIHCPHDLNHVGEFRDDLPVLLGAGVNIEQDEGNQCWDTIRSKPIINIFENVMKSPSLDAQLTVVEKAIFLSPYGRYKLAKKYSESVETQALNLHSKNQNEKVQPENSNDDPINDAEVLPRNATDDNAVNSHSKRNDSDLVLPELKKRQVEEEKADLSSRKRLKKEDGRSGEPSVADTDTMSANQIKPTQAKTKKRTHERNKDKQFVPYNYETVNFDQYKSSIATERKTNKRLNRKKQKRSKKSLKISI